MKKLLLATTGVIITVIGLSINQPQAADERYCESEKELATQIMRFRQRDGKREDLDVIVTTLNGQAIVNMAFGENVVPVKKKREAVEQFSEKVHGLCREGFTNVPQ